MAMSLLDKGYEVRGMVMPGDPAADKLEIFKGSVEVVQASLTDQDAIIGAVEGADYVVHLAVQLIRGNTPTERFFDINAMGTMRLLEAAAKGRHPVERFVLASTDGTYDVVNPEYLPMDENHPQLPGDYYGTSKLLGEHLTRNYGKQWDLPYSIVRYGTVVAADEILDWFRYKFWMDWLRVAEKGRNSHVWPLFAGVEKPWEYVERAVPDPAANPAVGLADEEGRPWTIQFSDVRDVVGGTILAMEHRAALGEAFNIVSPDTVAYDHGAKLLAEKLDIPAHVAKLPARWRLELSGEKARRVLGFRAEWTYAKMLESALAHRRGEDIGVVPALVAK
jgi:UDP-glucose 4-epimerase